MRLGWASVLVFSLACSRTTPPENDPKPPASTGPTTTAAAKPTTLAEARRGFVTQAPENASRGEPAPPPPKGVLDLVHYPSPVGPLAAYVTPRANDGKRRAAIVWIVGGFENDIDGTAWKPQSRENDQSARAFREAGVALMLPSLRGGNDNAGRRETLYGEVDDVIAARDWLAQQDGVDPERIYLGGHSTGGTLALLIAETTNKFRAVFSFGPVARAESYASYAPVLADPRERHLRSPLHFMASIRTPTFIIEGSESANVRYLPDLARAADGAPVKTFHVDHADHFNILAPVTALLAKKILADTITLTQEELAESIAR